jgi:hypothetical protein
MKKSMFAVSLLSVSLLSACGTESTTPVTTKPVEAGPIDMAVSALLPQGSFTVTGGFTNTEGPVTAIDGYVKYGTDPDGKDCEADYTLTNVRDDAATSTFTTKQRSVRSAGATSWYQNISDPAKPSEWLDHTDPNSLQIPLLFVPNIIADDYGVGPVDGAGNGQLCAMPLMARIMKIENGQLAYDIKRAEATVKARSDRWAEGYIDAVGATGRDRQVAVELLQEIGRPSFSTMMERTKIKVTKNADGSYEITQSQPTGFVSVRLLFTPTTERSVEPVSGTTYFAKVTEEVKNSGLTPREYLLRE